MLVFGTVSKIKLFMYFPLKNMFVILGKQKFFFVQRGIEFLQIAICRQNVFFNVALFKEIFNLIQKRNLK